MAAGFSSRMHAFKPLLPFGGASVLSRLVTAMRGAGVESIYVVSGYQREVLSVEIKNLRCNEIYNAEYPLGMFSSVQAAAKALENETMDGYVLHPVDIPLLNSLTIETMAGAFFSSAEKIVWRNVAQGVPGHPLLVNRAMLNYLSACDARQNLREIIANPRLVKLIDVATCQSDAMCDMDTPDDYLRELCRMRQGQPPDANECLALLDCYDAPPRLVSHSLAVGGWASDIATRLSDQGHAISPALTQAGGLLHDLAKGQPDHEQVAASLLATAGYGDLAAIVASHQDLDYQGKIDEAALVYLADKLFQGDEFVGVERRFAANLTLHSDSPEVFAIIKMRKVIAMRIAEDVCSILGASDQVLI